MKKEFWEDKALTKTLKPVWSPHKSRVVKLPPTKPTQNMHDGSK